MTSAAFTGPVGSSVVTASRDGTARIWDALFQPELEEVARLAVADLGDRGRGRSSPRLHGRRRLHVLDAATGEEIEVEAGRERDRSRPPTAPPRGSGSTPSFSRERTEDAASKVTGIVCARWSSRQTERCWRRPAVTRTCASGTRRPAKRSGPQHNSEVRDASFSPDGRWVVSAAFRAALWIRAAG